MSNPFPIIDGHNDTILRLHKATPDNPAPSFFEKSEQGHIDLPRALEGGLAGGFFALFTPSKQKLTQYPGADGSSNYELPLPEPPELSEAQQYTLAMAARLFRVEAESAGRAKIVRTVDELAACLQANTLAMIFHIEGAEAIDTDLNMLEVLYQAGLRSLGITWSRPNAFGHGVPFKFPSTPNTGPGLTEAGKGLVRRCNRLGILIDLSHLNEKGFWDVAALSDAPLVATHSGAHALSPSARNLTDKQLDAIRESDGIVGVNFHIGFLREDGRSDTETPLTEIVRHTAYIAERVGIDRVGLGSDFDGATMPHDLGDVAGLPKLITALQDHGFDEAALRKITHENWLRVLGKIWR